MRILHVITGLGLGGAETVLERLISGSKPRGVESSVISLRDEGPMAERIRAHGAEVSALGMHRNPAAILSLPSRISSWAPDVVQTWMYHGNLLGGWAARRAGVEAIVWGVHSTDAASRAGFMTRGVIRRCASCSRTVPHRIVCCSESARNAHEAQGYPAERMTVIPNGFDTSVFRPDAEARARVRAELGVGDAPVVGVIGRYHPAKDHANFIEAAAIVRRSVPQAIFVLAGAGCDEANTELARALEAENLLGSFRLLGRRADVPAVTAALDVSVLSSRTEAFPNVVGEAMACAVPCVVTDVGDAARMVGDTGLVVPPSDPSALAHAIVEMLLSPDRQALGARARARVGSEYELQKMVDSYLDLYRCLKPQGLRSAA